MGSVGRLVVRLVLKALSCVVRRDHRALPEAHEESVITAIENDPYLVASAIQDELDPDSVTWRRHSTSSARTFPTRRRCRTT